MTKHDRFDRTLRSSGAGGVRRAGLVMHRFLMIDGLRGIGAVAIALYHIFRYGPLAEAAGAVLPDLFESLIDNGWMAVQWFFVISGFGSALATRNGPPLPRQLPLHLVRRLWRLGPIYWISVALCALLTIGAIGRWNDRSLNESMPTVPQLLAHLVFLQDVLDYEPLNTGIWYVAIAVQLDVVFLGLLSLATITAKWMRRDADDYPPGWWLVACFAPLTLWSLFVSVRDPSTDMWFHHFFCLFMAGTLLGWAIASRASIGWFFAYVALILGQLTWDFSQEVLIALVAVLTIYGAWRLHRLQTWLTWPVLQYLGKISYSLFLIHYPVSWLVGRLGFGLTGSRPGAALAWLVVGFLASVLVAHVLHATIERPLAGWWRRFGWGAALSSSGAS